MLRLDGEGALYEQICRGVKEEIRARALAPGDRVPSTRELAHLFKVSRNTAVLAYEQLIAEGYLQARGGGAGTVVADTQPFASISLKVPHQEKAEVGPVRFNSKIIAAAARAGARRWDPMPFGLPYDFRPGRPVFPDIPYTVWRRLLGARARSATVRDLDYGPPEGQLELREAIAYRLRRLRGVDADPARIVIVNGTQQALDLISQVLLNPGDAVVLEEPHYTGARAAFVLAGAELIGVPVDKDGIQISKIPHFTPVRLVYVTPSHQFPTGVVLPLKRRLDLLTWASRNRAFIIEDDYDSEFRYDGPPLPALAALDKEGWAIYIGTFSKLLFPSLRLGYIVLPSTLVEPFAIVKAIRDTGTATLEQLTLADFIRGGHFDRHLRRTNIRNAQRRATLVEALKEEFGPRVEICGANAGLHLLAWLKTKAGRRISNVSRQAQSVGVGLFSVDSFYLNPPNRTGVVLGYASLRESEIREGIRRFAQLF